MDKTNSNQLNPKSMITILNMEELNHNVINNHHVLDNLNLIMQTRLNQYFSTHFSNNQSRTNQVC